MMKTRISDRNSYPENSSRLELNCFIFQPFFQVYDFSLSNFKPYQNSTIYKRVLGVPGYCTLHGVGVAPLHGIAHAPAFTDDEDTPETVAG
eukprot:1045127-Rhodomonas_salina.1